MPTSTSEPQIDPVQVDKLAPLLVVQLAKLTQAVMARVGAGDKIDPSIHIEMGNAVALLVKCIQQENADGASIRICTEADPEAEADPAAVPAGNERDRGMGAVQTAERARGLRQPVHGLQGAGVHPGVAAVPRPEVVRVARREGKRTTARQAGIGGDGGGGGGAYQSRPAVSRVGRGIPNTGASAGRPGVRKGSKRPHAGTEASVEQSEAEREIKRIYGIKL